MRSDEVRRYIVTSETMDDLGGDEEFRRPLLQYWGDRPGSKEAVTRALDFESSKACNATPS